MKERAKQNVIDVRKAMGLDEDDAGEGAEGASDEDDKGELHDSFSSTSIISARDTR